MFVNVTGSRVDITDRNVVIASVPRAKAEACQRIEITSSKDGTFATFVGLPGGDIRSGFATRICAPA